MAEQLTRGQKAYRTRMQRMGGAEAMRRHMAEIGRKGGAKSATVSPYSFANDRQHASDAGTKSRPPVHKDKRKG